MLIVVAEVAPRNAIFRGIITLNIAIVRRATALVPILAPLRC